VAVNATEIDNGLYVTKVRAGTVEGPISISAVWVSSPQSPLPQETVNLELVTADTLTVELDDPVVLGDAQDEATIIAYLLDGLDRPVNNADVTFRLIDGSGTIIERSTEGRNGRYAATFRPGRTPGTARIEVALPTNTQTLREEVEIEIVESATFEALAFPTRVARRLGSEQVTLENTATILVPIRDGDGDLVRGLDNTELVAQVMNGPGEVIGPVEILLDNNNRSGVYKFSFIAGETTGQSTVRVLNIESPSQSQADVVIDTVTEVNPSRTEGVQMFAFADDPFYADGASQGLLVMLAGDRSGNAVTGLGEELEVIITEGQGFLSGVGAESANLSSAVGSGIYLSTFTAGTSGIETGSDIRATFLNADGTIQEQEIQVDMEPLGSPRIVVFPPRIPSSREARATIDVFDFDTRGLEDLNLAGLAAANSDVRYRVDIVGGPGNITHEVDNSGGPDDLVADDNVSTAVFEVTAASGAEQETTFTVIDLAAAGYPTEEAMLEFGTTTTLRATTSPIILDQGDTIEVIAFAQDEFGLPAVGHDLRMTVVSGSAQVLNGGQMIDSGLEVGTFMDPFQDDGMYIGALRATGTTGGTVVVRITDITSPNQPELELDIEVRE
jgi:adhesin/invasin